MAEGLPFIGKDLNKHTCNQAEKNPNSGDQCLAPASRFSSNKVCDWIAILHLLWSRLSLQPRAIDLRSPPHHRRQDRRHADPQRLGHLVAADAGAGDAGVDQQGAGGLLLAEGDVEQEMLRGAAGVGVGVVALVDRSLGAGPPEGEPGGRDLGPRFSNR